MLQNVNAIVAEYRTAKAAGHCDIAVIIAGEAVALIHDISPAATIVARIVSEAAGILESRHNAVGVLAG